jgi:leucyl aminopeptidase
MTNASEPVIVFSDSVAGPEHGSLLVIPLTPAESPEAIVADVSRRFGLRLEDGVDLREITYEEGGLTVLACLPRVALAGLGDEVDDDAVRNAAAAATRAAGAFETTLVWAFDERLLTPTQQIRAVVEGVILGGHDQGRWKTTAPPPRLQRLVIAGASEGDAAGGSQVATTAGWTNRARELVDAPPNELTPEGLAQETTKLLACLPVEVDVLDLAAIERAGLRALATVGRGSTNEPRLIALRYRSGIDSSQRLGLVGKGVTFDSGGLFLKPQSDIVRQKADMGGAAAVIAAVAAIAELELPIDVLAIIPAAENMLGGAAYRPSDIITTASGLTVEVTNPDAEGRLLLADGIWYAKQAGVGRLVDVATLTGAMRGGMGDMYSGVFANVDDWRDRIVAAGQTTGDHAWPWPLHRRYHQPLDSKLADMRNTSGRGFGYPIFAASFLARFVGDTPWAHLDIYSTAFLDEPRGYLGSGATGAGVRLLTALAGDLAAST